MRDQPYGCHNHKPFNDEDVSSDLDPLTGQRRIWAIEFRMSRDCQYTKTALGQIDPGCSGCKWRQGV